MSTFNVGDSVEVILSANVTTIAEVLTRTDKYGNSITLYRLEGRPREVLYLAEDLRRYTKSVSSTTSTDTTSSSPDLFTQVLVANLVMDQLDVETETVPDLNTSISDIQDTPAYEPSHEPLSVPEVTHSSSVDHSWESSPVDDSSSSWSSSSVDDSSSSSSYNSWSGDSGSSSSSDYSSSSSDSGGSSSFD